MATIAEEPETQLPLPERVARRVAEPVRSNRQAIAWAIAAGAGSLAPEPFGVVAVVAVVLACWDAARRR